MKIGMPVLFEYSTVLENIELAKKLKFDFIELNLNFSYCREYLEKGDFSSFAINNLEATLHFYDEADFASYDEVVSAYLLLLDKYLEKGKGLIKILNVHLNEGPIVTIAGKRNYIYEKEFDSYIKKLKNNLFITKKICEKYNVELVIENVVIPDYMKETYKLLCNDFLFNFDIGHDNNNDDRLLELTKETKLHFKEFHIHDGNRKSCHLALGKGNIDINYFKQKAIEEDSYVVLEVKCSDDLIESIDYFRSL